MRRCEPLTKSVHLLRKYALNCTRGSWKLCFRLVYTHSPKINISQLWPFASYKSLKLPLYEMSDPMEIYGFMIIEVIGLLGHSCRFTPNKSTAPCRVKHNSSVGGEKITSLTIYSIWLVVWTLLKNISQLGWYGKIKNVPNHQPDYI